MEDSFKLLEGRIRRAAERLKELQSEADSLRADVKEARARATAAEEKLAGALAGAEEGASGRETLVHEVKALRREREEIRERLERLVELLDHVE